MNTFMITHTNIITKVDITNPDTTFSHINLVSLNNPSNITRYKGVGTTSKYMIAYLNMY